jgi:predicted NAD-dependent protein-ADP-ribosyltransferase YbiA (DUF1768 family)
MKLYSILIIILLFGCAVSNKGVTTKRFPDIWWQQIDKSQLKWWEIGPATAIPGKSVVLSKRNELGILSNFAATPIKFRGKVYKTIEALWQSMKYPESSADVRLSVIKWPYSRAAVEQMGGFAAKKAGDAGSMAMKKLKIDWVTFEGRKFIYKTAIKGEHYKIIYAAMLEKLKQNPKVKEVLLKTGNLELLPDHKVGKNDPPAWRYYKIWMQIRETL